MGGELRLLGLMPEPRADRAADSLKYEATLMVSRLP
jgi:hypothetical protein